MENISLNEIGERISNMGNGTLEIMIGEMPLIVFIEDSKIVMQCRFKSPYEVQEHIKKLIALEKIFNS